MRQPAISRSLLSALLLAAMALPAWARKKPYARGVITQMQSSSCGYDASSGMLSTVLGTGNSGRKAKIMLCKNYTLRAADTIYTIRPKDRHARLLPVGVTVLYRVDHDKLKVKLANGKDKKQYYVLAEKPAAQSQCQ